MVAGATISLSGIKPSLRPRVRGVSIQLLGMVFLTPKQEASLLKLLDHQNDKDLDDCLQELRRCLRGQVSVSFPCIYYLWHNEDNTHVSPTQPIRLSLRH